MKNVHFPRWRELLQIAEMDAATMQKHDVVLKRYLGWCRAERVGCTTESARAFFESSVEKGVVREEEERDWKEALNWFFREARAQVAGRMMAGRWRQGSRESLGPEGAVATEDGWEVSKVRSLIRRRGMALRTEKTYLEWYRAFMRWSGEGSPAQVSADRVRSYLTHLAVERGVASSTQKQALNALVFVFNRVFELGMDDLEGFCRANAKRRIPVVLTRNELGRLFDHMQGRTRLMAQLQYGAGLRLMELIRLRVKDVDLERGQLVVRGGKGDKDRVCPLPTRLEEELQKHLAVIRAGFEEDRKSELPGVYLPSSLEQKLPMAGTTWPWQWLWPSPETSEDPRSGVRRRHHISERAYQGTIRKAAQEAHIAKRVTSHALRHSFATHSLENGVDIRMVQELLGHIHIETTQVYLHVMRKPGVGMRSPLDALDWSVEEPRARYGQRAVEPQLDPDEIVIPFAA